MCIYTAYVYSASGGEKRASRCPELELQAVVSCDVGAGNQIWILWKSGQCSPAAEIFVIISPLPRMFLDFDFLHVFMYMSV